MEDRVACDRVLRDMFQMDRPSLFEMMTGGVRVREFLNVAFPKTLERQADLVALLEDGTIFHIEFQGQNDKHITYRSGIYDLLAWHRYQRPVRTVVLYVGWPKMRMNSELDTGGVKVSVRLIDIREIDSEALLRSGRSADLALAMLAKGGVDRLAEIAHRVAGLSDRERVRALTQLVLLSGLRKLSGRLKMELVNMGSIQIDIRDNEILRDVWEEVMAEGLAKGKAEGKTEGLFMALRGQLQTKFGSVPKWAESRVAKANSAQLEQWLNKIIVAQSLEDVIAKNKK